MLKVIEYCSNHSNRETSDARMVRVRHYKINAALEYYIVAAAFI